MQHTTHLANPNHRNVHNQPTLKFSTTTPLQHSCSAAQIWPTRGQTQFQADIAS
jgi:hypothetical protein